MKTRTGLYVLTICIFLAGQTQAAFFRGLGDMPDGFDQESTSAISADGTVVVGCGEGIYADEAFRWTFEGGLEGLGTLANYESSCALGLSADGGVIVGFKASGDEREAFRWTKALGMVGLGDLPGGARRSVAHAVSDNGDVVVGSGHTDDGETAFIWIRGTMSNLGAVLTDSHGLDLGAWILTAAKFVSADGNTIVGYGINPDGEREAWIAHIGPKLGAPVLAPPTGLHIVTD